MPRCTAHEAKQRNLSCRVLCTRSAMALITGRLKLLGSKTHVQRCKRLQHNPMLPTEVETGPIREDTIRYDLHYGGGALMRATSKKITSRSFSKD